MLVKGILLLTSIVLTVFPPYLVAQEFARDVADDVRKDIRSATQVLAITGHVFLDDSQLPTQRNARPRFISLGKPVMFDGQDSIDNVGIVSFSWDFGDGTTASRPITEHIYKTIGRFIAMLTVEDRAGNEASATIEIEYSFERGAGSVRRRTLP